MIHYKNGNELANAMNIKPQQLEDTFNYYNECAVRGKCPFGKTFFKHAKFNMSDNFFVSVVCPVLHFTMGGIQINQHSQVLARDGPIKGLYSCGECAGGKKYTNDIYV